MGGTGRQTYKSVLFTATLWRLNNGVRTNLECNLHEPYELEFDEEHTFTNDEQCLEQFTPKEILRMFRIQRSVSFADGETSKEDQIKSCLGLL